MSKLFSKKGKLYKIVRFLSKIIGVLFGCVAASLYVFIILSDILPTKYLIGIGVASIVIIGIIIFILFGKKTKLCVRVIFSILSLLGIFAMIWALLSILNTLNFFDKVVAKNYKTEKYYVVVRKDSIYNEISDLNGIPIYFYNNNSKAIDEVITNINEKITTTITKSNELLIITDDLLEKRNEAIIIESSLVDILNEENEEFKNNTKTIYTVSVRVEVDKLIKEVGITTEPFNLYISGIDTYGSITKASRSDVNIVATINPKTKQILLTSIPRDYYVRLHGTRGYKDKLTHAGIYGINMSLKTVEDLLDIDINYYAKINFSSVIKAIEVLGGIDVYSKYAFKTCGFTYSVGTEHMNGYKALAFARERHKVPGGDRTRGENQEAVIEAIIKKASNPSTLTKYNLLLSKLNDSFETNMSSKNIKKLAKMQLNDMASWNVVSANLNGTDSHNYTYSLGKQMLYVMEPKQASIDNAKAMIEKVKNGEIISAQ
ncbi:MAG TPA: LCP family protein [Bacilli bacterium]|nr:LCP family protein [Bacilli bacterium]